MNARFERVLNYLNWLNEEKICTFCQSSRGMLTWIKPSKKSKQTVFYLETDMSQTTFPLEIKSIKNHKLFKSPEGSQTIGIIPHKDKSIQLTNFANQIQKELAWMGIESSLKYLDPSQSTQMGV